MNAGPLAYLIDTGWVIRHLRGSQAYSESLAALAPDGLAISVITLAELREGVVRASSPARALAALETFLGGVRVLSVDSSTAAVFGELSGRMRAAGQHPGDFDVLIAATAMEHELTVLTTDVDDFSRFVGLPIITIPEEARRS